MGVGEARSKTGREAADLGPRGCSRTGVPYAVRKIPGAGGGEAAGFQDSSFSESGRWIIRFVGRLSALSGH